MCHHEGYRRPVPTDVAIHGYTNFKPCDQAKQKGEICPSMQTLVEILLDRLNPEVCQKCKTGVERCSGGLERYRAWEAREYPGEMRPVVLPYHAFKLQAQRDLLDTLDPEVIARLESTTEEEVDQITRGVVDFSVGSDDE